MKINIDVDTIGNIVRKAERDFISGQTTVSKHVIKSMKDNLDKIDAYANSKHTTGDVDSLGRDKPFFNIVTSAINIYYRATVIDVRKIKVRATKSKDTIDALLANVLLQDWFRRERFDQFLSEWGRTLAKYGSAVPKFVEKDGRLIPIVQSWMKMIVDAIDFDNNLKIEVLEYTEAQLRKNKSYDKKQVEALCNARKPRETVDGTRKDNKNDYIKLYEVHGELPLSYITERDSDDEIYVQQMHVISFVAGKEQGEFDDFTLYKGREEKEPNMITHLIKEDGQTLSIGAVQHLFEAQWMLNHSMKSIKDVLDFSSKIILQTADSSFVGQNVLSAIETGDILIHAPNMPLTQVNNGAHDISAYQNFGNMWKMLGNEIVGISESMQGKTAPAGTAWRQVETLLSESHSLFEVMRDNKGRHIEDMLRKYILPFLKKKIDTNKEVSAILEAHDIERIDAKYIKNQSIKRTNQIIKKKILSGQMVTPEEQAQILGEQEQEVKGSLADLGNQRFFKPSDISSKTWKKQFENFEWDFEIDTKDEQANNDALTTLTTMLKVLVDKQGQPLSPDEKFIIGKILAISGQVSPVELQSFVSRPAPQPMPAPQGMAPQNPQVVT